MNPPKPDQTRFLIFMIIALLGIQIFIKANFFILTIVIFICYFIKQKNKMLIGYGIIAVVYGLKIVQHCKIKSTETVDAALVPDNINIIKDNEKDQILPPYKQCNFDENNNKKLFVIKNLQDHKENYFYYDKDTSIENSKNYTLYKGNINDLNHVQHENKLGDHGTDAIQNEHINKHEINNHPNTKIRFNNTGVKIYKSFNNNFHLIIVPEVYFTLNIKLELMKLFDSDKEITKYDLNKLFDDYFYTLDNTYQSFLKITTENSFEELMNAKGYILHDIVIIYKIKSFKFVSDGTFHAMRYDREVFSVIKYADEFTQLIMNLKDELIGPPFIVFIKKEFAHSDYFRDL